MLIKRRNWIRQTDHVNVTFLISVLSHRNIKKCNYLSFTPQHTSFLPNTEIVFRNYSRKSEILNQLFANCKTAYTGSDMMQMEETEKREQTFKVLVVGDVGTGKTSFIRRYIHQLFSIHYKATIGADFALKLLEWDDDIRIKLQMWDIAGQERFGAMTRVYYRDAVGAFVVFDVTRTSTFEAVEKWKSDLDDKAFLPNGVLLPTILLANKSDQESLFERETIDKLCTDQGFIGWFETSSKENTNVDEAVHFLVNKVLELKNEKYAKSTDTDDRQVKLAPVSRPNSCCSWH